MTVNSVAPSIYNLGTVPPELQYKIHEYLSLQDLSSLSRVSTSFRNAYHHLTFSHVIVYKKKRTTPSSRKLFNPRYRQISAKIFFNPNSYSWFDSEIVSKVVFTRDALYEPALDVYIKNDTNLDDMYPNLTEGIFIYTKSDDHIGTYDEDSKWKLKVLFNIFPKLNFKITSGSLMHHRLIKIVSARRFHSLEIRTRDIEAIEDGLIFSKMVNLTNFSLSVLDLVSENTFNSIIEGVLRSCPNLKRLSTAHFLYAASLFSFLSSVPDTLEQCEVVIFDSNFFPETSGNYDFSKVTHLTVYQDPMVHGEDPAIVDSNFPFNFWFLNSNFNFKKLKSCKMRGVKSLKWFDALHTNNGINENRRLVTSNSEPLLFPLKQLHLRSECDINGIYHQSFLKLPYFGDTLTKLIINMSSFKELRRGTTKKVTRLRMKFLLPLMCRIIETYLDEFMELSRLIQEEDVSHANVQQLASTPTSINSNSSAEPQSTDQTNTQNNTNNQAVSDSEEIFTEEQGELENQVSPHSEVVQSDNHAEAESVEPENNVQNNPIGPEDNATAVSIESENSESSQLENTIETEVIQPEINTESDTIQYESNTENGIIQPEDNNQLPSETNQNNGDIDDASGQPINETENCSESANSSETNSSDTLERILKLVDKLKEDFPNFSEASVSFHIIMDILTDPRIERYDEVTEKRRDYRASEKAKLYMKSISFRELLFENLLKLPNLKMLGLFSFSDVIYSPRFAYLLSHNKALKYVAYDDLYKKIVDTNDQLVTEIAKLTEKSPYLQKLRDASRKICLPFVTSSYENCPVTLLEVAGIENKFAEDLFLNSKLYYYDTVTSHSIAMKDPSISADLFGDLLQNDVLSWKWRI